ncbi:ArsR/SmtB family transcription factor [Halovulum sp. GXIMD14793]
MALPVLSEDITQDELEKIVSNATMAAEFLKALGQESRLLILCYLLTGEKSVTEMERFLSARQAAVSQQLARLRLQGLVKSRRVGKTIFYSLTDDRPRRIIEIIYDMFCADEPADT